MKSFQILVLRNYLFAWNENDLFTFQRHSDLFRRHSNWLWALTAMSWVFRCIDHDKYYIYIYTVLILLAWNQMTSFVWHQSYRYCFCLFQLHVSRSLTGPIDWSSRLSRWPRSIGPVEVWHPPPPSNRSRHWLGEPNRRPSANDQLVDTQLLLLQNSHGRDPAGSVSFAQEDPWRFAICACWHTKIEPDNSAKQMAQLAKSGNVRLESQL